LSALGNIIKKELKELMTPATILPIVVLALVFGSIGNVIGDIEGELEAPPVIGVINTDTGNYSKIAMNVFENVSNVTYQSTNILDKEEAIENLKQGDGVALIIISHNFSHNIELGDKGDMQVYWIMKGAGILDSISSGIVESLIGTVQNEVTKTLIKENDTSKNVTNTLNPIMRDETTYFKGNEFEGVSPGQIASILSTQSMFIPIVMMMIILMAGQLVISSMALEKENKTLETLLTLPVKRTSIVTGKIVASAIIGLLLAIIYMVGMSFYLASFQIEASAGGATIDLSLNIIDTALIGVSVFVTLVAALAFCMLLGTMAKNFKSAQTLTFPVVILALVPMFITMMKDFDTLPLALKAMLFGIPFSHPMMASRFLIFGDYTMVFAGIIYVLIFAIIMIMIVVWIFKTDRIVTGTTKFKLDKLFKKRK
jgi:ABC-2 type transport system permease protein